MTPFDTSRSLTRRVPIYDSPGVVEYHGPVNSTKLLISRSVCYGVKGLQSDVPSTVYDALWGVDGGVVSFNESIDMNSNNITGVADGTKNNDAVNKQQLNTEI